MSQDPDTPVERSADGAAAAAAAGATPPEGAAAPSTGSIAGVREGINDVDQRIVALLAQRRKLSAEMVRAKEAAGRAPIRDVKREEDLLVRLIHVGREHGLDAHFVTRVFHEIIDDSIRLQQEHLQRLANRDAGAPETVRVSFQGIEGAYSFLAAKKYFASAADRLRFLGMPTFREAIEAVETGQADFAMLPVENTTSGSINEVYDLLLHTRLAIVGEEKYRVEHCLVACADVAPSSLRKVFSHPQAVAQCTNFLATLRDCQVEYFTDTAMSVSRVKEENDPLQAAIASEEAARMYGLHVIQRDIANQRDNFTRFLVAARNPRSVDLRIPCKTSIVMATAQRSGALVESLLVFRESGINLTKLHSRPILGNPWEEMFYLDFEGNIADEKVRGALEGLTRNTRFIKVLGSYPSQDLPPTVLSPGALAEGAVAEGAPAAAAAHAIAAAPAAGALPLPPADERPGFRLASRAHKSSDTVLEVRKVSIGGDGFIVLAGPRVVESREQVFACARQVKESGAVILRGGCFRAQASPHGFRPLGLAGVDLLAEAGKAFGLPVLTEVISPQDVPAVAARADILEIGARNVQNFALLTELGRIHRPVLVRRGAMSSLDELLEAAEHILAQGNQQVILCERGIRTFETSYRNTLDLSAVAALRQRTHLPIVVDPASAAGQRDLVSPLSRAARALGAHGVLIDLYPDPETAASDGPQALDFAAFRALVAELVR